MQYVRVSLEIKIVKDSLEVTYLYTKIEAIITKATDNVA